MGNQFFHIGEEKAENGVDVADAFRRLAETMRGNPNGHEAKQQALTLLRRRDINGVLGETRVEWLKKDISKLQDTESIQTFLVNSSRYMEKEGIAKLSWENLSKYLGQLDQPAQESDTTEGDFSKRGSPMIAAHDDKRKHSEIAKNMPDAIKLKDAHPQDIESHWKEMDETQRIRVAKEAGFNEVESRELAKLAWEGLDPSIKKDLSWVLNADPEHLPSKDDFEEAEAKAAAKSAAEDEAQEDLDNLIKKEMDAAVQSFAEARAAESWSKASDGMIEDYGKDVHVTAEFGEWLAVNGALIMPGKDIPQPPAGFQKTKFGGAIPDFEVEVQMETVKDFVSREMKFPREMVERVIEAQKFGDTVTVKVSGKSEVFAPGKEPILTESVEEFQKGGWSQDRTDGVWSKKVGKKSGAAFPSHADAFGTHLWSVYDGNKLIGRGEAKTDKEAMAAADAHLSAEPVPIGEDGAPTQAEIESEIQKAADSLVGDETVHTIRGSSHPEYGGDHEIIIKLKSVDTAGSFKTLSDGDYVLEPKLTFEVEPDDDSEVHANVKDEADEKWTNNFESVVGAVMKKMFPGMEYSASVNLSKNLREGWLSIEFWNKGKYEALSEDDGATLHTQLSTAAKKAVPEADPFDIEAAIYWFASDNYRGMGDPLYGVLSLSKFKPGPTHRSVEDEGETASEIYNHLKSKFSKSEAEEPETNVRPMTIDPKTRRQANAYLSELSSKYWPGVPLFDIAETLKEKFGIEVEDSIVTGAQGRDTFELKKGGMPIKNSMLALSWFKMPVSGKYEITAYLSE